jgi:hypothetical protein
LLKLGDSVDEWPTPALLNGVWTIFPHVSIASFDGGGGRGVMISQLLPGDTPESSSTAQLYLLENEPNAEQREAANAQFKLLEFVVREEDYATGLRQQRALQAGLEPYVLFGRNEGGGQRFHRWLELLLATPNDQLERLFGGQTVPGTMPTWTNGAWHHAHL